MFLVRRILCCAALTAACAAVEDGSNAADTASPSPTPGSQVPDPSGDDLGPDVGQPVGCRDFDRDGASVGEGCSPVDCNDSTGLIGPDAPEQCNGIDDDCDGIVDDDLIGPDCALTRGICAGSRQRCLGGAWAACDAATYGESFEVTEAACDGVDNDCDGIVDDDCPCDAGQTRPCGVDEGECHQGVQACLGEQWGPCDGETTSADELCDGKDNDCDDLVDEALTEAAPDCGLNLGVCAGSRATCSGGPGWSTCGPLEYGDRFTADETDLDCDALDNDCDGATDEQCACLAGADQPCGPDVGACVPGIQTCVRGFFGECRGQVLPRDESCDGTDQDCDGTVDEALAPLACPLQNGVCAGSVRECSGLAGHAPCQADVYSAYHPLYVPVESSEHCDGLDNDCDGLIDEECDCVDGTAQACGVNVGLCTQGEQLCVGGRFGACDGTAPLGEVCNAADDDCDERADEGILGQPCRLQDGVCAGSRNRCLGGQGTVCGADEYGGAWQLEESFCDGRDNDCDGQIDEGCDCVDGEVQVCGSEVGLCTRGAQTCVRGRFGPCEGSIQPAVDLCDGRDEDCDGQSDEALIAPACPNQVGVCAGALQLCAGALGFLNTCAPEEYGPRFVLDETDAHCDGLDNDCDGRSDEACECQPNGPRPACGINTGECRTGLLLCEGGHFGACEGEAPPVVERCNGLDDDCDGLTDDALIAPACALSRGVCDGSVQRCRGADGWLACEAVDYGPNYRLVEAAADCDGRDNDCDGRFDEACPAPPIVISEVYYNSPGRDGTAEFIEISGPVGTALSGLTLEAVNGNDGLVYERIGLNGRVMPAIGSFLIVAPTASPLLQDIADLVAPGADLQNGPDSLRLVWNGDVVVDALGYGVFVNPAHFAGEGEAAPNAAEQSLTRNVDNADTDNNAVDFVPSGQSASGLPTPRGAPLPRLHLALRWDLDDTDLDLHLQRPGAAFRDATGDCSFSNRRPIWNVGGGDPRFERDDTDGFGPEFIDYPVPRAGDYLVQVHLYADRSHGPTTATVTLFADGQGVATFSRLVSVAGPDGPYWAVAVVRVGADGSIAVIDRDQLAGVPFANP